MTRKAVSAPAPKGTLNDRRWQEVLDAATEVFEEKGYQAATLQDVASRLRILAPSLYYYIKNKEELLFAVMQRAHQLGLELIEDPPQVAAADAATRLDDFIRRWMGGTYPPRIRVVERDIRHLTAEHQAEVRSWRRRINRHVQSIVRQGVAEGAFRPDVDPAVVAHTLFAVLNSVPTWYREGRGPSYRELTEWQVDLFVGGLRRTG